MQEAGLPEREVYKSLIRSLRRNKGGQYRQKRGNKPWGVEWPKDSVGVVRLGAWTPGCGHGERMPGEG